MPLVICDLAVDPYLPDDDPPVIHGIEGIPQGNLDQWAFDVDDPAWVLRTLIWYGRMPGVRPDGSFHGRAPWGGSLGRFTGATPVEPGSRWASPAAD